MSQTSSSKVQSESSSSKGPKTKQSGNSSVAHRKNKQPETSEMNTASPDTSDSLELKPQVKQRKKSSKDPKQAHPYTLHNTTSVKCNPSEIESDTRSSQILRNEEKDSSVNRTAHNSAQLPTDEVTRSSGNAISIKQESAKMCPLTQVKKSSSGNEKRNRRRPDIKAAKIRGSLDEEFVPTENKRQVQTSIRDIFPVRRSTRKCKTIIESETQEKIADKLRNKNEEGLKVVAVKLKGKGVVPTRPFVKGELICEYSGELIDYDEAKKREKEYLKDASVGCYMYYFSYKTKLCVDATKDNGRKGRLLNHSKTQANVVTKLIEVDDKPYLCLMAARDIKVGEELQYDYGERSREVLETYPWLAS